MHATNRETCVDADVRRAYDDRLVRITEVRCRAPMDARRAEVVSSGYVVVLSTGGLFTCGTSRGGQRAVVVDPTTALLVNPGDVYRIDHPDSAGHSSTIFSVPPALLSEAVGWRSGYPGPSPRFPVKAVLLSTTALVLAQRLRFLWAWQQRVPADVPRSSLAPVMSNVMLDFLRELIASAAESSGPWGAGRRKPGAAHAAVRAAKVVLATTPGAAHPIVEVAAKAGVSSFHLAHVFRAETGLSLHQYLLRLRIALALGRLLEGETNLSRLALDLGFCSHSHFSAVFRRQVGMSPAAARGAISGSGRAYVASAESVASLASASVHPRSCWRPEASSGSRGGRSRDRCR